MGPTETYSPSTLSVMHLSFEKGDMLVFLFGRIAVVAHDRAQGVLDQDIRNTIMSLSGVDFLDAEALLSCEKAIGHSFIPSADIDNIADRAIRNV